MSAIYPLVNGKMLKSSTGELACSTTLSLRDLDSAMTSAKCSQYTELIVISISVNESVSVLMNQYQY